MCHRSGRMQHASASTQQDAAVRDEDIGSISIVPVWDGKS